MTKGQEDEFSESRIVGLSPKMEKLFIKHHEKISDLEAERSAVGTKINTAFKNAKKDGFDIKAFKLQRQLYNMDSITLVDRYSMAFAMQRAVATDAPLLTWKEDKEAKAA